ncbi:MAG: DUF4230 domain-containing protein [Anaerolineales bacterium]
MKQNLFSLLILVVLLAGVYFIVQTVREGTQQAVAPLEQANAELRTQVASLLHPTPTIIPDPVTYINQVQALARLETIQYSVEKVVTAEQNQGTLGFLLGDRLIFVAHGIVIAGVDMQKIMPQDMWLENGVLYVRLPPAEVFVATLDNEKSYFYDRETGLLTKGVKDLETLARRQAEQEVLKAALEDGILEQARKNAEAYLLRFFMSLGYKSVVFVK